jgi:hypothetical protein
MQPLEDVRPLLETLFTARSSCRPPEEIAAALAAVHAVIPAALVFELQAAYFREYKQPGSVQRVYEKFVQDAAKAAKPKRPKSAIRKKDDKKVRRLVCDPRCTISHDGSEVIGTRGKALTFKWDRQYKQGAKPGDTPAIPFVYVAGKYQKVFDLLVEVGFQESDWERRARYFEKLKKPPVVNSKAEAQAEDPELNVPKGFDSWDEARTEDPETFGTVE